MASKDKLKIDNILLSGYLREHGKCTGNGLIIPKLVFSVISVYCKEYLVRRIGWTQKNQSNISLSSNPLNTLEVATDIKHQYNEVSIQTKVIPANKIAYEEKYQYRVIDIQFGSHHTLLLTLNGSIYAFGSNDSGQCGLGENSKYISMPTLIPNDCKMKSIACGALHSLFIDENGKLLICGYNYSGQLGIDTYHQQQTLTQKQINSDTEPLAVFNNDTDIYIDDSDGSDVDVRFEVISDDEDEEDAYDAFLDDSHFHTVYTPKYNEYFDDLNIKFNHIECGPYHSSCITSNGECYVFGQNEFGNLGTGECTEFENDIPHKLQIRKQFVDGSCGNNHNILITKQNEIVVFGDNRKHQCSIIDQKIIKSPYILSKEKEFGISKNCIVEKVICIKDESFIMIDVYNRNGM